MHTKQLRDDSGVSLIEVTIAMAIVAILALGVMLGFTTSGTQDRQAKALAQAQSACVATLEDVESFEYEVLFGIAGGAIPLNLHGYDHQLTVTQIESDLMSIEISTLDPETNTGLVRLVTLKTQKVENS